MPFNDVVMIKRRRHQCAFRQRKLARGVVAGIEKITRQTDLDKLSAENPRLVDFLLRRRDRHENNALAPEMPADIGKTLGMIPGGCTHEQVLLRIFQQRLADEIEGSPDLVGADR